MDWDWFQKFQLQYMNNIQHYSICIYLLFIMGMITHCSYFFLEFGDGQSLLFTFGLKTISLKDIQLLIYRKQGDQLFYRQL